MKLLTQSTRRQLLRNGELLVEFSGHAEPDFTPVAKLFTPDAAILDSGPGCHLRQSAAALKIKEAPIAPRSPWQNPYAEHVIGSIRRECLDHQIVLGTRHLRRILSSNTDYYNGTRMHLALYKDAPEGQTTQPSEQGKVIERGRVGGFHHEYMRIAA